MDLFADIAKTYDDWYETPLGAYVERLELTALGLALGATVPAAALEVGAGTGRLAGEWEGATLRRDGSGAWDPARQVPEDFRAGAGEDPAGMADVVPLGRRLTVGGRGGTRAQRELSARRREFRNVRSSYEHTRKVFDYSKLLGGGFVTDFRCATHDQEVAGTWPRAPFSWTRGTDLSSTNPASIRGVDARPAIASLFPGGSFPVYNPRSGG